MLNFRNVNILFLALLALTIGADIRFGIAWYVYLILPFLYSIILFYGCYFVHSNFFIPVICSLKTDEKVVAISFDDGPVAGNTGKILQTLKDNDVKAAFFCIGNRIADNEDVLKQVYNEGHLIGNHTYTHHFWFDMFSSKKMLSDMQLMDELTNETIGKKPKLFRPPYGITNPNLKRAITNGNYIPVGWNARSLDTVIKDEEKLLSKMMGKLRPGAVFLFHDTSDATVAILPAFIKYIHTNGYQIIRPDKMLNLQAYA